MTNLIKKYQIAKIMQKIELKYGRAIFHRKAENILPWIKAENILPWIDDPVDQLRYLDFLNELEHGDRKYMRSPEFRQKLTEAMRQEYSVNYLASYVGIDRRPLIEFLKNHPNYQNYRKQMRKQRKQALANAE